MPVCSHQQRHGHSPRQRGSGQSSLLLLLEVLELQLSGNPFPTAIPEIDLGSADDALGSCFWPSTFEPRLLILHQMNSLAECEGTNYWDDVEPKLRCNILDARSSKPPVADTDIEENKTGIRSIHTALLNAGTVTLTIENCVCIERRCTNDTFKDLSAGG